MSGRNLEERVATLERELSRTKRRYRRVLAVCGGVVVGAMVILWAGGGAPSLAWADAQHSEQDIVRAREFVVEGEGGEVVARLGVDSQRGGGAFQLYGASGVLRAGLGVSEIGPVFQFYNEDSKTRLVLGATSEGPLVLLTDKNETNRMELSVIDDQPGLYLKGENGEKRAGFASLEAGSGLVLWDNKFQSRAVFGAGDTGPFFRLKDESGTVRLHLGATTATTETEVKTTYPESYIRLADSDGNVIWSAPR